VATLYLGAGGTGLGVAVAAAVGRAVAASDGAAATDGDGTAEASLLGTDVEQAAMSDSARMVATRRMRSISVCTPRGYAG
jgi:hypothetical protein